MPEPLRVGGMPWDIMGKYGRQRDSGGFDCHSWIFDRFVANSHPPSTIGLAASSQIPVLFEFCNGANRWGNNQTACKPGSVRADRRGTAIPLGRALRRASRDQPGRQGGNTHGATAPAAPIRSCSRWGLPCRRRCRRRGTLLPHHFTLARGPFGAQAVCFLWHCPWGRPRRPLAGTAFPWSPDFPPLTGRCLRAAAVRPSDISEIALRQRSVKLELGSRTRRRHAHKKAPMPDRAPPGRRDGSDASAASSYNPRSRLIRSHAALMRATFSEARAISSGGTPRAARLSG
jgi:hypothetical protein